MSKKKKVVTTKAKEVPRSVPTVSRRRSTSSSSTPALPLIFDKGNYLLMLAGIGLIALGLVLMSGGSMPSPDVWDEDIIYSTRRIVIAPLVILIGLLVEIYAIFKKTNNDSPSVEATA